MDSVLKKMVQFKSQELGVDITEEYKESLQKELVPLIERDEKNALKEKVAQLWLLFCGDELGIVNSRIAITLTIDFLKALLFSKEYSDFGASQRLLLRQLLDGFLRAGNSRVNSLETFIASARELIADLFEFDEEWSEAARVLGQIPLDSGHRSVSNQEKIRIYIKIMRLLLEADDPVSASVYVNRAALLIDLTKDSQDSIQFKSCQARILDSNRAFLKAAWKYFELSCNPLISEEDRLITLSQSMKCVVLAEAGAQRSRFLATLYKDERSQKVEPGVLFIMIEYMYLDRMISSNLKKEFAEQLSPHHLSRLADGSTLLDRAVVEHNIVSCSKVYRNVYVNQLAIILDVPEQSVELTVGKMVAEGILAASIDQICGLVYFHDGRLATDSDSKIPSGIDQADPVAILANQWETQVKMVGGQVEDVFCLLRTKYPQWFLSRNSL